MSSSYSAETVRRYSKRMQSLGWRPLPADIDPDGFNVRKEVAGEEITICCFDLVLKGISPENANAAAGMEVRNEA